MRALGEWWRWLTDVEALLRFAGLTGVVAFTFLILILLLKPTGLLGKGMVEKV